MLIKKCSKLCKLGFDSTWTKTSRCLNWILKQQGNQRSNWQHPLDHRKSKRIPLSSFASLTTLKPLTVGITTNCGTFLKRWKYRTTLPASWGTSMQVKKQQLELDMEQWTGSKLGKDYVKAVYYYLLFFFHLALLICMLSSLQFSSVQWLSHVQLFVTPWTTAHQASLSITNSQSLPKPMSIESVMPSSHLILCHPLILLPSIFPSIKGFSNESALHIRWPKYWSFRFSITPSNEHPGLL